MDETATSSDTHQTSQQGVNQEPPATATSGENAATNPNPTPPQPSTPQPSPPTPPTSSPTPQPKAPEPTPDSNPNISELSPKQTPVQNPKKKVNKLVILGLVIVIVIILIAGAYAFGLFSMIQKPTSTTSLISSTTTYQTTVPVTNMAEINSCNDIGSPGIYYITKNIKYDNLSGSCISINSNNVELNCNDNKVIGSGPYTGTSPFSYGVYVANRTNVSLVNCQIMNFSYGAYLLSVNTGKLYLDNLSFNTVSNLVLNNSRNISTSQSYFSKAASSEGSIYLTKNSTNNTFANNTVRFNAVYGINVNSTGNNFRHNYVSSSPSSFYCSATAGFPENNKAILNTCYNSTGCGFIQCNGFNLPPAITSLRLAHGTVAMCGSINSPGYYGLSGNLIMSSFVNTTNPLVLKEMIPCISIRSSNVHLSCNGFAISGAPIGINASDISNITISNCNITDSTYGINFINVNDSTITKTKVSNSSFGIKLIRSHIIGITNISAMQNIYGLYMIGANTTQLTNFDFSHNYYGIYVNGSFGNYFNSGSAFNDSELDIYATPDDINQSLEFSSGVTCGVTDALWVKCNKLVSPTLLYYPVDSCGSITQSGNYLLTTSIIASEGQCFTINASNVQFNCGGKSIIPINGAAASGAAFSIISGRNVTVTNCAITGFKYGLTDSNAKFLSVSGFNTTNENFGIMLNNISNGTITNNKFAVSTNSSIALSDSTGISIVNNTVSGGPNNIGFELLNSTKNQLLHNKETSGYLGLLLSGNSVLNTISNNTASLNSAADYECTGRTGAFNAQYGGINYGSSKIGCTWLAAIPITLQGLSCQSFSSPATYTFVSDEVYPYGSTCFSANTGQITINCNQHTIYATNGGTFAWFTSGKNNVVENCYLKGFSQPIVSTSNQISLLNDTIMSTNSTYPAVNITGGSYSRFAEDNISSTGVGLYIDNSTYGTISHVDIASATAYVLKNVSGFEIQNINSTSNSGVGLLLSNSTLNYFSNSGFGGLSVGILCTGSAEAKSSNNNDNGGISCHSNSNCAWISASSATCK
jgi:hypothetical protein